MRLTRTEGFRLTTLFAGIFLLAGGIVFALVYWISSQALEDQVRVEIRREASELMQPRPTAEGLMVRIRGKLAGAGHFHYLLVGPLDNRLAGDIAALPRAVGWSRQALAGGETEDRSEKNLLVWGERLPNGNRLWVGASLQRVSEAQEAIRSAFGLGLAAALVAAVAGGVMVSLGFLRRVDAINRTTRAIIGGDLSHRVPVSGSGDELDHLAQNLNAMLARMENLMDNLRQVSRDLAHDLRTPLTRLRQKLESASREPARREAEIAAALKEADELLDVFNAILRLAQIEAGQPTFAPVALSGLLSGLADTYRPLAEEQGRFLQARVEAGLMVSGNHALLTQMFVNLLENALTHTPPGTPLEIGAAHAGRGVRTWIEDRGPGIPAHERDRVLRRFYRLEASRSTPGSGLGLALVDTIAQRHGLRLQLSDAGPGLRVEIFFPAAAA